MKTIQDIVAEIGTEALQRELHVGYSAIANAVARGNFPTSWYLVIDRLCREKGIECPRDLFNFKGAA